MYDVSTILLIFHICGIGKLIHLLPSLVSSNLWGLHRPILPRRSTLLLSALRSVSSFTVQAPIDHTQCAVGQRGDMRVMRHDDQGAATFAAEITKHIHHLETRALAKTARRLVGPHYGR